MPPLTRSCPKCPGTMRFRLGEYECEQCGHTEPAGKPAAEESAAESPRRQRREQWEREEPGPLSTRAAVVRTGQPRRADAPPSAWSRTGTPGGPAPKFVVAPHLSKEKLALMVVFTVKGLVSVFSTVAAGASAGSGAAAGAGDGATIGAALAFQAFDVGVMFLVLYVPFVPLKWCCATYSCFVGLLSLAGLLLGGMLMTVTLPFSGMPPELIVFSWLLGFLETGLHLWLASVLYRDIQNLQA